MNPFADEKNYMNIADDDALLSLKMEDKVTSRHVQLTAGSWKRQRDDHKSENQLVQHLYQTS